jgi:hypothetical protein
MYEKISIGLLGFLIVLIMPFNINEDKSEEKFYGVATILVRDSSGNEIFSQTTHNRLFDAGEDFILNQIFTGLGTDVPDATQIGSICISAATPSTEETESASAFNMNHDEEDNVSADSSTLNCRTDDEVTSLDQSATIGPLTFTAKDDNTGNWYADDTILGIGICRADSADADVRGCDTTLFAVVDTSNVQLADAETVDITYTFDMSSSTT